MEESKDYVAFEKKFILAEPLPPPSPTPSYPPSLQGLTFAVKSIFELEGHVPSFGNPDWAATHPPANSTAPTVQALLHAGATCLGITVMDEMAYSINGENIHYGTPRNPCAPDCVPGGSSSGSAVAVAARIVDFSLGTDTGGSVRVPASYCGILGFRPSHGVISVEGVIPMAQSFDTVGWFARDPDVLNRVGRVLLPSSPDENVKSPSHFLIADDCFQLSSIPVARVKEVLEKSVNKVFEGSAVKHLMLGDYVKDNVPSLAHFINPDDDINNIPSLAGLSSALRLLQRYEFKHNHERWVTTVNPNLGPGISERVLDALKTTDESIHLCRSVKNELRVALTSLIGDYGVLAIPTVPGPPPKLKMLTSTLETFRNQAFSLLSIAGLSGFCQVSISLGVHNNLPVSVSLLAKHGSDKFLLNLTENIYSTLQQQSELAEQSY